MTPDAREWLETDGLGGYAMGGADGVRTRRYHGLLVAATRPPAGRMVLVNDLEVFAETARGRVALSSHRYRGPVVHPDGAVRLAAFRGEPWPTWEFALEGGARVAQEIFVVRGAPCVIVRWTLLGGPSPAGLWVRPLLSGRDHHALHQENPAFDFGGREAGARVGWRPYPGVPAIEALSNGDYQAEPEWYRGFLYSEEAARGLDAVEDLASPGFFVFDLARGPAVLAFAADGAGLPSGDAALFARRAAASELARRSRFPSPLHLAADAYLVSRGEGRTVLAGYPWFTDWGRDTFIALRGLCFATGRWEEGLDVVLTWAGALSKGMLPNRFPESGAAPEFNSVDAALWFVLAAGEVLLRPGLPSAAQTARLRDAVAGVVEGYAAGTRWGIRRDGDGLLACGEPGTQLTWMDARVAGVPVTPRVGKPVEVQALWLNALAVAAARAPRLREELDRAEASFRERFWNPRASCLFDVVDCDHRAGATDASFRPNQILAAGGLPVALLEPSMARLVVDSVETRLWTPAGLRSLASDDGRYRGRYEGDGAARDAAYHQGTVWPWLSGPFVDAWVRSRGGGEAARREARRRFLEPLLARVGAPGVGHLPELADGDPPHAPRGCPFQAWSVAEALRIGVALGAP
jgi:predicted glycogen debranching enzyme